MPTETGYPDDEQVAKPHGNVLAEGAGVSVPASPAFIADVNLGAAAYRSIVFTATVVSNPIAVEIDWSMSLDGSGVLYTTATSLAVGTTQQRIQCAGRFIYAIRYSGSGGAATMDYTVVGSNIDPLPRRRYPIHQWIDLGALFEFGNTSAGTSMVTDGLLWSNHRIDTGAGINGYITFMLLMGPQYARHEILLTHNHGPDYGIESPYLAKLAEDADPSVGFANPAELINSSDGVYVAVPWVLIPGFVHDNYNVALVRNQVRGIPLRVEGAEGDPFTAVAVDSDGFTGINGGPGIYALQLRMATKNAASAGYRGSWSSIGSHRIDDRGFL